MPSRKSVPFVLSLVVGIVSTTCFVALNGSLANLLSMGEDVSRLQYWYGWILVGAVFWFSFVLTWAAYSCLFYLLNRLLHRAENRVD